ncbi:MULTISPECIES: alpha/beta hydrolase [unclassified Halomonas]|uniref:alpha/beta hydrolase n=1 Tax=unclassified Halomonas TaxID=2609666 RepID=UPI000990917B|nr:MULTISPECIES: dienelactone hydrolase family protein [unclassified Halomonas]AQU82806.1 hypothetical protein B2G49_09435 [Halomonas sp. 'Soap Lake \
MNIMNTCGDKYISKYIGEKITSSKKVIILLHGRRQSPDDFFDIAQQLYIAEITWILACAPEGTWYPHSFLRAIEKNQPHLDNALSYIDSIVESLIEHDIKEENIFLVGFSQGACVVSQYLFKLRRRLGGAVIFTGGLFGPEINVAKEDNSSLLGMPIFISGSMTDSWVPASRIIDTANCFESLGAKVKEVVFAERKHLVSSEEIEESRIWFEKILNPMNEEEQD